MSDVKKILSIQIDIDLGDVNTGRARLRDTYEAAVEAATAAFKKEHEKDAFSVSSKMTYSYRHFVLAAEESGDES